MQSIPFFSDDIAIRPHTATNARDLNRRVTIRQFTGGKACGLYQLDNGDLMVRMYQPGESMPTFIEGPEVQ